MAPRGLLLLPRGVWEELWVSRLNHCAIDIKESIIFVAFATLLLT